MTEFVGKVFKDILKNLYQYFWRKILFPHHNLNSKTFTCFRRTPVDFQMIIPSSLTVKPYEMLLL